ncbi:unnamed protein product [Nippostrongylus brasiliensis]|uniref:Phage major capsid protein n=1 Tax=Nippostrongylus brasiliensis TaxID=27835 RepID=A0A0N4XID8_NIPBR|nr:unnamed protein product [Nippostrongylus brasiliensis]
MEALQIQGGDTGYRYTNPRVSAIRVEVGQTSRTHQPVATTQFGDVYDAALRTKDTTELSGTMMNIVTAAGRIDNAALYNLFKMRPSVVGASYEEAAPTMLF